MKNYLIILSFFTLMGCSSDSSIPDIQPTTPFVSVATFAVNGNDLSSVSDSFFVTKCENTILLRGGGVEFFFNKYGKFGSFEMNIGTQNQPQFFYNFKHFSAHYINFQLISFDEINKRVKGKLFGFVSANSFDLNSESKYIELNFDYVYYDVAPIVKDLKNHCKINGVDWDMTNKYLTKGAASNNNNITQHDLSDNEYKIMVNYNIANTLLGTHNFLQTDISNNIQLEKYDISTGTYIRYNCTGTLNIFQKENIGSGSGKFILAGLYSFNAMNPNNPSDVIQVTDGKFKLIYQYF